MQGKGRDINPIFIDNDGKVGRNAWFGSSVAEVVASGPDRNFGSVSPDWHIKGGWTYFAYPTLFTHGILRAILGLSHV